MIAVSERICRCARVPSACAVIWDTRARECLSAPTPRGLFLGGGRLFLGAAGRGSFLYKRLSLDDPRPQGGQVLRPRFPRSSLGPSGSRGKDRLGGSPGNRL